MELHFVIVVFCIFYWRRVLRLDPISTSFECLYPTGLISDKLNLVHEPSGAVSGGDGRANPLGDPQVMRCGE